MSVEPLVWGLSGAGVVLVLVGWRLVLWWRRRRRRFVARWATRNGYTTRQEDTVHLFVQGPPFDRGDGIVERALLVGVCAGRPALIVHTGWYYGDPHRIAGSAVALALELPTAVPPLQLDARPDPEPLPPGNLGIDDLHRAYQVECADQVFLQDVLTHQAIHFLLTGPARGRMSLRLDGTALVVWFDGELRSGGQLSTLHDFATAFYRLIPAAFVTPPAPRRAAKRISRPMTCPVDIHGRPGEVWEQGIEVHVSMPVHARWPELSIVAYELLVDQYRVTRFDRPEPSAHPLVDVMFAVRSTDGNFRRMVLAELADWLPLDERARRCAIRLDVDESAPDRDGPRGRILACAPGRLSDAPLVAMLVDMVHEVSERLSLDTYRHRPGALAIGTTTRVAGQQV